MNELKCVFWDLDGTIADTEIYGHRCAFNKTFKDFGLNWNWDVDTYIELLKYAGGKNRIIEYSKTINQTINIKKASLVHKIKTSNYCSMLKEGSINLRPGVLRLIKELKLHNIKQWIVTTSSKLAARDLINSKIGLFKYYFDGIISAEDVHLLKPNPEAYLLAMQKANIKPQNVLAIEDSINGLKSALQADINCVITLTEWNRESLSSFKEARLVVNHLGDPIHKTMFYHGNKVNNFVDIDTLKSILNNI